MERIFFFCERFDKKALQEQMNGPELIGIVFFQIFLVLYSTSQIRTRFYNEEI